MTPARTDSFRSNGYQKPACLAPLKHGGRGGRIAKKLADTGTAKRCRRVVQEKMDRFPSVPDFGGKQLGVRLLHRAADDPRPARHVAPLRLRGLPNLAGDLQGLRLHDALQRSDYRTIP